MTKPLSNIASMTSAGLLGPGAVKIAIARWGCDGHEIKTLVKLVDWRWVLRPRHIPRLMSRHPTFVRTAFLDVLPRQYAHRDALPRDRVVRADASQPSAAVHLGLTHNALSHWADWARYRPFF